MTLSESFDEAQRTAAWKSELEKVISQKPIGLCLGCYFRVNDCRCGKRETTLHLGGCFVLALLLANCSHVVPLHQQNQMRQRPNCPSVPPGYKLVPIGCER